MEPRFTLTHSPLKKLFPHVLFNKNERNFFLKATPSLFIVALFFSIAIGLLTIFQEPAIAADRGLQTQQATSPDASEQQESGDKEKPVEAAGEDDAAWRAWEALPNTTKSKIDPHIVAELRGQIQPAHLGGGIDQAEIPPQQRELLEQTRFIVYLQEQPDLDAIAIKAAKQVQAANIAQASGVSAVEQRTAVVNLLVESTRQSQRAMRSTLDNKLDVGDIGGYHSFYIVNAIAVDGTLRTVIDLARRPDVDRITANYPLVPLWDTTQDSFEQAPPELEGDFVPSWNIAKVGAEQVWSSLDILGQGAVVAGFDTGVVYQHPALVEQYRGNLGNDEFDHNYSWFEPDSSLYPDGNLGPSASDVPSDCHYYGTHGTHTMGTMVGNAGASNSDSSVVGMAPRARWIAVPGICSETMSGGIGDDIGGLKAFQWLLCPTDLSGDLATADCSKAPDVINNSWGSANPFSNVFEPVVNALRAAGVASVFAAGNPSAGPGSIGSPANIPAGITVGATDSQDNIASFSALGPSPIDGEQKPELSAPGVDVLSTVSTNSYSSYSGTSMAAPHVAGLVALMVSADLKDGERDFNIDELEYFMEATAVDLGAPGPDPIYGHGRIDALAAVRWASNAGDLRGVVRDAETDEPISSARVIGHSVSQTFSVTGGSTGIYSLTVPVGVYDVMVDAWGYEPATFPSQSVFARSLSIADFALSKLPASKVSGAVRSGEMSSEISTGNVTIDSLPQSGAPVSTAKVYVMGSPAISTTTAADGSFELMLPAGEHVLAVEATQHRLYTTTVSNNGLNAPLMLEPEPAPTILLVHADASNGWFFGWPVHSLVENVLKDENYHYDFWPVETLEEADTFEREDGEIGHGIPSTTTLAAYDVVIWLNSGCGGYSSYCGPGGSPIDMGAEDELIGYLEGGGRLILSGQNIAAASDGNSALFDDYLYADRASSSAAGEGDAIFGNDFLSDLSLEVTNAALYGYRNGILYLSPDAVTPEEDTGNVIPILSYENGSGAAALAVSPCNSDYRALYFSVGYESMGPRADNRAPDFNVVLDRGIDWLLAEKQAHSISLVAEEVQQNRMPGSEVKYQVRLLNTGQQEAIVQFSLTGDTLGWITQMYERTEAADDETATTLTEFGVADPITLAPCQVRAFELVTAVPDSAGNGETNELGVIAELLNGPAAGTADAITADVTLTTRAFVPWRRAGQLASNRFYSNVTAQPDDIYFYVTGGADEYSYSYLNDNLRYNVCTDEWEELESMPIAKSAAATAVLNGKIYLFGGRYVDYSDDDYYYDYGETSDDVQVFDIATNTWSTVAPMPLALRGAAAAVANDKIYLFGGSDGNDSLAATYVYDPATDLWEEKEPMPEGGRLYASAATASNGKIYVANGWPELTIVEAYDPLTDRWESVASTNYPHDAGGLIAAPDGYLYVAGGGDRYDSVSETERYNLADDEWEVISSLKDGSRYASSLVYVAGRLYVIGGGYSNGSIESLIIDDSFCLSSASATRAGTEPGGQLSYEVKVVPDSITLSTVQVTAQIPVSTTFASFSENSVGALYNADSNQVEWVGTLAPNTEPLTFTFDVTLDNIDWANGSAITNTIRFENVSAELSGGPAFTNTVTGRVYIPDLAASYLSTDRELAIVGEELTYTVNLRSTTTAGGRASITSIVPNGLEYIPDTLTYENGTGTYEAATRAISWSGLLDSDLVETINNSEEYAWVDSLGGTYQIAADSAVEFDWIDIKESATSLLTGDERTACDVELGFRFDYYGETYETFCIDTNGRLLFASSASSDYSNDCPLADTYSRRGMVAVMWDDLVVADGVYVETLGVAPNRYTVVQWAGVYKYGYDSSEQFEFQAILYETGEIKIQTLDVGNHTGFSSTTGVGGYAGKGSVTYACNEEDSLQNELAILFVPPGSGIGRAATDVSFDVQVTEAVPFNTTLTNTVEIMPENGLAYTRSVQTRFNTVNIEAEAEIMVPEDGNNFTNDVTGVNIGDAIDYQFILRNTGPLTATNVAFAFPFDNAVTYTPSSVTCTSGACTGNNMQVSWYGSIAPSNFVTVTFSGTLEAILEDNTLVEGIATVKDGSGQTLEIGSSFMARSSNVVVTIGRQSTTFVEPGERVLYEIYVRNTGHMKTEATLTAAIPLGLTYVDDSVLCGRGQCQYINDKIEWSGVVAPRDTIPVRLTLVVPDGAIYGQKHLFDATVFDQNRQELVEVQNSTISIAHNTQASLAFTGKRELFLFLPMVANE